MRVLARAQTGRISAFVCLAIAIGIVGALFALLPGAAGDSIPSIGAPASAESSRAAAILDDFPDADQSAGIIVWSRPSGDALAALSEQDLAAIADASARLAALSSAPEAVRPQFSEDGTVGVVVAPVEDLSASTSIQDQADELRQAAAAELPDGLRSQLSGPVGFQADTANSFAGADVRLLVITASIVALLLIVTYRSPVLWIVPLAVVGTADGLARFVVGFVADRFGIPADASILGILSVLVFGAGTNYALLLIARYREELLRQQDRRAAMRTALRGAGPAILASGGTVIISLLALSLAQLDGNRALGIACAIGIAIALCFALLVLPAAVVVFGRGLFWPFIPRFVEGSARAAARRASLWARLGGAVARRPVVVVISSLALVGIVAVGLLGARIGLSQTEQLIGDPESVQAQEVLSAAFPGGYGAQTSVVAPDSAVGDATAIAEQSAGVDSVRPGQTAGGYTELTLTLAGEPQSEENFETITALRSEFAATAATAGVLVGGADATALDVSEAAAADRALLIPVILGVVFVILMVLLRSLVAPVLLIVSVLATFFASLGAGNFLFQNVFGFAAFDTSVVLYSFLFLVALGVDYNIFLTTRAREERAQRGAREGMLVALTQTGGVITSAGILLAAVFVVLGVLPVVALAQIGTIVCIGVLLDTLVVRTLLVPALAFLLGERFWWPSRPAASVVR